MAASPLAALGQLVLRALAGGLPGAGLDGSAAAAAGAPLLLGALLQQQGGAGAALAAQQQAAGGSVQAVLPEGMSVEGVGSSALLAAAQASAGNAAGGWSLLSGWGEEGTGGLFEDA